MPGFDIDAALRWPRFDPSRTIARSNDSEPPSASAEELAGHTLLLDRCVYIDQMQGRAPDLIEQLVDTRHVNHSIVAIEELTHTVGVLRPEDSRAASVAEAVRAQIAAMPDYRVFTPDADVLGRAALLAGMPKLLNFHKGREATLKLAPTFPE